MTLEDVLKPFDNLDRKIIDENDVGDALRMLSKTAPPRTPIFIFLIIAFSLPAIPPGYIFILILPLDILFHSLASSLNALSQGDLAGAIL